MKEKVLMTAFLTGHLFDSVISYAAFSKGWQEEGFLKYSQYLSQADKLIVAKMGVVALMIGAHALFSEKGFEKAKFVTEKTLLIGSIAVWGVQMWNILNVVAEVALKAK